ncbi:N-6 DNA methylase [Clostridiaceae bacterium 35-E11]
MLKHHFAKLVDRIVKDKRFLGIHKDEIILELCKAFFVNQYGIDLLNKIGIKTEIERKYLDLLHEVRDLQNYSDIFVFCNIYEDYLSIKDKEKTGTFYTPDYIVDYMVQKALVLYLKKQTGYCENLLCQSFDRRILFNKEEIEKILEAMDQVKIIDIACGTGLFLIKSFEKIYNYKRKLYKKIGVAKEDFIIRKYIVEKNIFGIDIQEKPILITKMALMSLVYEPKESCYEKWAQLNIVVGDSLTQENFFENNHCREVTKNIDGFDIVLGNPPYIGEKGNKNLFDKIKHTTFGSRYYEGKMDYFYFFIYKSLEILKEKGVLGYITTNYFITADGAQYLRKFLKKNCTFRDIVNFNDYGVFKCAKGQHNLLFFLTKGFEKNQPIQVKYIKGKDIPIDKIYENLLSYSSIYPEIYQQTIANQDHLYNVNGHILVQGNRGYDKILQKIHEKSQYTLHQLCNINQGIVSGADKVTKDMLENKLSSQAIEKNNILLNQGIFVLTKDEVEQLSFLQLYYLKPMYKNSDIHRYYVNQNSLKYILYLMDDTFTGKKPDKSIINHLYQYKEVLEKRREVMKGTRVWYALQWPRNQEIFEGTKIVVPHRAKENKFALSHSSWYASADVYFITAREKNINWHVMLAQLNSKIMYFWLYNRGKRKGDCLELYANPLKSLPIIANVEKNYCNKIVSLVQCMMKGKEHEQSQKEIDQMMYDLYGLTNEEIKEIENLHMENLGK